MPSGLKKIRQLADDAAARAAAYDENAGSLRFFKVGNGETVTARFLEQGDDVKFFWTHQLPKKPGQQFGDSVLCLDQDDKGVPCPGCTREKGRTARIAINLIWFGAPKFRREAGKEGKPGKIIRNEHTKAPELDGIENCVATWNTSQSVGGRLDTLHENAVRAGQAGLMLGVYSIGRRGSGKATEYDIDLIEYRPPTAEEVELFKSKPDPKVVMREVAYGDMERAYAGTEAVSSGDAPNHFTAAANDVAQRGALGGGMPVIGSAAQAPGVDLGAFGG